jgi:hypothetical protein
LTTVNFGVLDLPAARAFVKAPQTRFVRELFIGYTEFDNDFDPHYHIPEGAEPVEAAFHTLLRWPRLRQFRRLQLGWQEREDYGDLYPFRCSMPGQFVCDFVARMPDLEELLVFAHFQDGARLFALPLPRLRVLQLYHGYSYPLEVLAANPSVANLTHLLCHPHGLEIGEEPYIRIGQLRAVCRSPHLKSLTHLRLRLTDFGDEGAGELVDSGILKRLKVLDLRLGCVTDKGANLLAACPDLRHLEFLDLSGNALTDAGIDALRSTKVPVGYDYQHSDTGWRTDGVHVSSYLYRGDCE